MAERRILIVTNRVPFPFKDGGNLAMQAMIDGYHQEGWQVYLLSMNTVRHYVPATQLSGIYKYLHSFECVNVDNRLRILPVLRNFFFSKAPEHTKRFSSSAFRAKLAQICRAFSPDVVQIESVFLSTYLDTVKSSCDAITVLRLHNIEYQIWQGLSRKFSNRLKQFYLHSLSRRVRNFERDAWKQYDLLLTITEKDASMVNRLEDVSHMIVAPYSVDLEHIKPSSVPERWVGYHLGAMDWMPNNEAMHWFLDKAWPGIHKALPKFEFYFAGRGMPANFQKLNISGVYCVGEVNDAEEFIADKKILIVPIWSGGGIRVKILEAMAASKVVITTAAGIKGIDARSGEHYLLVQRPTDFVRAISWCLENKEAAEEMAKRASELVKEKYENKKVIQAVIAQIEMIIQTRLG